MATLRQFPVVVEVLGWGEAFLGAHTGDPEALAADVQRAVNVLNRHRVGNSNSFAPAAL